MLLKFPTEDPVSGLQADIHTVIQYRQLPRSLTWINLAATSRALVIGFICYYFLNQRQLSQLLPESSAQISVS